MSGIKTNPNAMGGSFNYDSRKGLGYGQTSNTPLGSNHDMGDALFNPIGPYDDPKSREKDDDEEIESEEELAFYSALDVQNYKGSDAYAINKRNPNSYNGLANTSAYLGLSASHQRNGDVLREFIREVILDECLNEYAGISGNIAVASSHKAKNLGNKSRHYHIDNSTLGSMGMTNGAYIDNDGYGQSHFNTTDGSETINKKKVKRDEDESDIISAEEQGFKGSTAEYYNNIDKDYENILIHIQNIKYM